MKSSRVSSRRLSFIVVVTFGLASVMESAPSEDVSSVPRSVVADESSPSSPPSPPSPPSPLTSSGEGSNNEEKVLFECRHSDYRTYIKCLKRQKRHHWQQQQQQQQQRRNEHETSEGGEPRRCFAECGFDDCESTKCIHDCHKRCMKKTKETRQIITQYETTCLDGTDECTKNPDGEKQGASPTTNVTTNIDINNVINNHRESPVQPCGNLGAFGCDNRMSLVPQLQLVPQITFGLGIGYGINFQQDGVGAGGGGRIDCSPCGNPWMRYRCDVSCYARHESQVPNVPKQASEGTGGGGGGGGGSGAPGANCILPYCVGGSPA